MTCAGNDNTGMADSRQNLILLTVLRTFWDTSTLLYSIPDYNMDNGCPRRRLQIKRLSSVTQRE